MWGFSLYGESGVPYSVPDAFLRVDPYPAIAGKQKDPTVSSGVIEDARKA
jgi:hypothetical protein